jgi:hypothetical protein
MFGGRVPGPWEINSKSVSEGKDTLGRFRGPVDREIGEEFC